MRNRIKSKISVSLIMLYLVFFSFSMLQLSQARYMTSAKAGIGAETAKWTFKMNGKEDTTQEFNINLNECKTEEENSINGVIAPGSKGNFDLEIDCTDTQTAIKYEIKLTQNERFKFPDDISVTYLENGQIKNLKTQTISGTLLLEDIKTNPIKTIPIDWEWKINEKKDENEFQGENLQISITITGSQIYENEN